MKDAQARGLEFTKAGYIYEVPKGFLGGNKARRQRLADENGQQGLINSSYPAIAIRLQAEYIAAVRQGNTTAVQQANSTPPSVPNKALTGNWDVSKADSYAALVSNEKSSLTSDQETQNTYLSILCENNKLILSFMWMGSMFPDSFRSKDVDVLLQWDSNAPQTRTLSADKADLYFPAEMTTAFIDNLKKYNRLTLRIRDSKNKWNLVATFKLEGATEAIATPIAACRK